LGVLLPEPGSSPDSTETRLDPNHSYFVAADQVDAGSETDPMFVLAEALYGRLLPPGLLAGGGETAKKEVLRCLQLGWPILVIQGSGGLADQIASLKRGPSATTPRPDP